LTDNGKPKTLVAPHGPLIECGNFKHDSGEAGRPKEMIEKQRERTGAQTITNIGGPKRNTQASLSLPFYIAQGDTPDQISRFVLNGPRLAVSQRAVPREEGAYPVPKRWQAREIPEFVKRVGVAKHGPKESGVLIFPETKAYMLVVPARGIYHPGWGFLLFSSVSHTYYVAIFGY
jgi:hypothetical protein